MKGQIANFSAPHGQGVIRGEDGQTYVFNTQHWGQSTAPVTGQTVEFVLDSNGQMSDIRPLSQDISLAKPTTTTPAADYGYQQPAVNPYQAPQHMGTRAMQTHANPVWDEEENYGFIDWVKKCLRNYANFNGRARRKEYWFFYLFFVLAYIIGAIIDYMLGTEGIVAGLISLGLLLPNITVGVRRLHDIGKSGWWMLISLIPLIGSILILVWYCTDTKPETNQWGAPARRV